MSGVLTLGIACLLRGYTYLQIFIWRIFSDTPPDDGGGILEWVIRALVALLKIVTKLGTDDDGSLHIPSFGELIVAVFGENFAEKIEAGLINVTDLPKIVENLQNIIGKVSLVLLGFLVIGVVAYWSAYSSQEKKKNRSVEKLWGNRTLLLDPLEWFVKRFLPYTAIAASPLVLAYGGVNFMWKALNYIVEETYTIDGTTFTGGIVNFLDRIAESGGFGVFALIFVSFLIVTALACLGAMFALRLIKFLVAFYVAAFNLGLWLDGSRLRSVSVPFWQWLLPLSEIALTVLLLRLTPLILGRSSEIVGFFLLLVWIPFAAFAAELIKHWFPSTINKSASFFMRNIDNLDERPSRPSILHMPDPPKLLGKTLVGSTVATLAIADAALSTNPEYLAVKSAAGASREVFAKNIPSLEQNETYKKTQKLIGGATSIRNGLKRKHAEYKEYFDYKEKGSLLNNAEWFALPENPSLDYHARTALLAETLQKGGSSLTKKDAIDIVERKFSSLDEEAKRELSKKGIRINIERKGGNL